MIHYAVTTDSWKDRVATLEQHGEGSALLDGVEHPVEVVRDEEQHGPWHQKCFEVLSGLGQEEDLTRRDQVEHYRIEEIIRSLPHRETTGRASRTSV